MPITTNRNQLFSYISLLLLGLGIYLELAYQTFSLGASGLHLSPIYWLLGGLLTCGGAFYLAAFSNDIPQASDSLLLRISISIICFGLGAWYIGSWLSEVFAAYPIDPKSSDIVPSLQLYVRRWLAGETVYAPFQFPGWVVLPTYFPLLWMPYAFSEILQIDYRWTAYLVFLIALAAWNWRLIRQQVPLWELVIKVLFPFAMLHYFLLHSEKMFGFSVELLPIGFYLILALSIFHRSRWLMALGILLCLLSRYAFTFWLPVYLLLLWIERGFKTTLQVGLYTLLGVAALYIIPFLIKDPTILTNGLAYYAKTAETQWELQSWQQEGNVPYHLGRGLSFAIYFYDHHAYTVMDRLASNRKAHLLACTLAALLLLAGYFIFRKRGLNVKIYLLIGLKFYLLIFYGFFYVPFSYLYMLPFFLTIPILYSIPIAKLLGFQKR